MTQRISVVSTKLTADWSDVGQRPLPLTNTVLCAVRIHQVKSADYHNSDYNTRLSNELELLE